MTEMRQARDTLIPEEDDGDLTMTDEAETKKDVEPTEVEEPEPEQDRVTAGDHTAQDLKRNVVTNDSHNAPP